MFCRMYEKILFFGAYLPGREWMNLDNHHERLQKPPQYPFNYCFSASICRASYEPLNKNPAFDRSYAMPCGRMSDEVSVFHSVPSAAACDPRHTADLAPAAKVGTLTDPSQSFSSPLNSTMPLEQYRKCTQSKGGEWNGGRMYICVYIPASVSTCFAESASAYNTV